LSVRGALIGPVIRGTVVAQQTTDAYVYARILHRQRTLEDYIARGRGGTR
jgi:hypothetical protein